MQGNSQGLFTEAYDKAHNPHTQKLQTEWEQKPTEEIAFAFKTYTRDLILPILREQSDEPTNVADVEAVLEVVFQKINETVGAQRGRSRAPSGSMS